MELFDDIDPQVRDWSNNLAKDLPGLHNEQPGGLQLLADVLTAQRVQTRRASKQSQSVRQATEHPMHIRNIARQGGWRHIRSVGLGATNACDAHCGHCYSAFLPQGNFSEDDVEFLLRAFPNIECINWGSGESYLNPDFRRLVCIFYDRGIRQALTTNGMTLEHLTDEEVQMLHDVDISLDYPLKELHDAQRGHGFFDVAVEQLLRTQSLGVDCSVATALTKYNFRFMSEFEELCRSMLRNCYLRINIYKPVHEQSFCLSYDEFWEAMSIIATHFDVVVFSEPLMALFADETKMPLKGSPCGNNSMRVHSDGIASHCVYLYAGNHSNEEFIYWRSHIPNECKLCHVAERCMGGCLAHRILMVGANKPHPYCPIAHGRSIPDISWTYTESADLVHAGYLCTSIFRARR